MSSSELSNVIKRKTPMEHYAPWGFFAQIEASSPKEFAMIVSVTLSPT